MRSQYKEGACGWAQGPEKKREGTLEMSSLFKLGGDCLNQYSYILMSEDAAHRDAGQLNAQGCGSRRRKEERAEAAFRGHKKRGRKARLCDHVEGTVKIDILNSRKGIGEPHNRLSGRRR